MSRTIDQEQLRVDRLRVAYSVLARQREVFAALEEIEGHVYPVNNDEENWQALVGLVASEILDNVKLIWDLSAPDWRTSSSHSPARSEHRPGVSG